MADHTQDYCTTGTALVSSDHSVVVSAMKKLGYEIIERKSKPKKQRPLKNVKKASSKK